MKSELTPQARNDAVKAKIVECVNNANNPNHYIAHDGKLWLDDVLRTLNKPLSDERTYWYIVEDTGRIMRFWDYTTGDAEDVGMWSLGLSYDDQPQPTKDFLYSVLFPSHEAR